MNCWAAVSQRRRNRPLLLGMLLVSWVVVLRKNGEQTRAKTARKKSRSLAGFLAVVVLANIVLLLLLLFGARVFRTKAEESGDGANQQMKQTQHAGCVG